MNQEEIQKITEYIFIEAPLEKSEVAMVFGTRFDEPVDVSVELYRKGYAKYILFSGGINKNTQENEAERMEKLALKLGVPQADVILEKESTNTLENVLFSLKILDKKIGLENIHSIIAIVKHCHARRALMTIRKHFPKHIKLIPYPYVQYGFTRDNWTESEIGRKYVLGEKEKIEKYLEKGDIEEVAF